jgi:hypothetical protein
MEATTRHPSPTFRRWILLVGRYAFSASLSVLGACFYLETIHPSPSLRTLEGLGERAFYLWPYALVSIAALWYACAICVVPARPWAVSSWFRRVARVVGVLLLVGLSALSGFTFYFMATFVA